MNVRHFMAPGWLAVCGVGIVLLGGIQGVQAEPSAPASDGDVISQSPSPELVLPFTDVPPDHWAYQALLNLAGTYGCVSGYPDGTFRGDNAMTRNEFAAGLDSCLSRFGQLLETQQEINQQEVDAMIEDLESSLEELRQLDDQLPDTP
jgi:hypothetical protein